MTPERALLVLGLLFGLLFLFVTPPYQVPDEPHHVLRSYHVGEGHLRTAPAGGLDGVPASLPDSAAAFAQKLPFNPEAKIAPGDILASWRRPLAPDERREIWIFGTYLPLSYLPQAAGAAAARLLGLPALGVLYLARLGNLLACLALAWAALRVAPFFRWTLALLALTPMALFLRSSASPDAVTNALAALLLAAVLALAWGPEGDPARRRRDLLILFAAALGLVLCKGGGYALFSLLILIVPRHRLAASQRRAAVLTAGLLLATLAGFALSAWTARQSYDAGALRPGAHLDPQAQAEIVLADPLRFAGLVAGDYLQHGLRYLYQFVGNLGWLDTPLPLAAAAAWSLLLLAVAIGDGPAGAPLSLRQRLVLLAVVAGTLAAISASQYLTWTPVGAGRIEGLQGRYFIPAAPLVLLLFTRRRSSSDAPATAAPFSPRAGWPLFAAAGALLTTALTCTVLRYYVD
ncbi:MAG TPA: DUF2142 domain-containing protein [Thermoanaerobaculia bacterium]|nr:DUF2142 domain-containing protein [Thermoanaerobaculia bacterium]